MDYNPYAPPEPDAAEPGPGPGIAAIRRDGDKLVVTRADGVLPMRCIRTGATEALVRRTVPLYYLPVWTYLLVLPNLLIFLIVGLIVGKSGRLTYWISRQAQSGARWTVFLAIVGLLGTLACVGAAVGYGSLALGTLAVALLVGSFVGLFRGRVVWRRSAHDLGAVRRPVVVGVRMARVGAPVDLVAVQKAVPVGVRVRGAGAQVDLGAVVQAVVIGVPHRRVAADRQLVAVSQAVAVGVPERGRGAEVRLVVVQDPVLVGVHGRQALVAFVAPARPTVRPGSTPARPDLIPARKVPKWDGR